MLEPKITRTNVSPRHSTGPGSSSRRILGPVQYRVAGAAGRGREDEPTADLQDRDKIKVNGSTISDASVVADGRA
jgi:hypothetical protein